MPVAPAAGQLRYTRLPTSDGEIADYPSAFFLVEELSASRFIIARPWLVEDTEEDIISPVELPDVPGQQLAYEVLDLTGLKSRMTPLPESVLFDFSDERKPNPFTLAALVEHIPEGLRNSASEYALSPQAPRRQDQAGRDDREPSAEEQALSRIEARLERLLTPIEKRITALEAGGLDGYESRGGAQAQATTHGVRLFQPSRDGGKHAAVERAKAVAGTAPKTGRGAARAPNAVAEDETETSEQMLHTLLRGFIAELRGSRESDDNFESTSYTAGVKGLEKLEKMRDRFAKHPDEKYQRFMKQVRTVTLDVPTYMEKCTPVQRDRFTTYLTVLMCEVLAAAEQEDSERVRGLAAGGLQMLEQWAINGALELGWLYTLLPDSPLLAVSGDTPKLLAHDDKNLPTGRRSLATLADPALVATTLASIKNYEELSKLLKKP